ncbi:MAG: hypothetical protein V4456_12570 [Bacteroidota bacterium]
MNQTDLKQTVEDSLQVISEVINTVQMLPKDAKKLYDAMNNIHSGVVEYLNQD